MQPNEIPNHDHASASLKTTLLVFVVFVIVALSYFVWMYQNQPDTADYDAPSVKSAKVTAESK